LVVIDSIIISGNNQTKDFIILRELTLKSGDTLTTQLAQYNRERIYSLDIFNEVKLKTFKTNNRNYLLIDIEESWYIYPIPIAFLNDRDWNKISYGMAVKIKNFRGRNEEIFSRFTLGFDPSVDLAYFNPSLAKDLDLFTEFQFGYSISKNRSNNAIKLAGGDFEYNVYYGRIIFGKRFGLFHRVFLTPGFDYVESPFYIKNVSASNQRIDRTVILGLNYAYDTRDLIQYAKDGIFTYAGYEFKGLGINDIN
jgi:outer membrane protein assembly factor BamA